MTASLNGLNALVFTAGAGLSYLGLKLDKAKNNGVTRDEDIEIAQSDSFVRILVIHTQEEWAIAAASKSLMKTAISI